MVTFVDKIVIKTSGIQTIFYLKTDKNPLIKLKKTTVSSFTRHCGDTVKGKLSILSEEYSFMFRLVQNVKINQEIREL